MKRRGAKKVMQQHEFNNFLLSALDSGVDQRVELIALSGLRPRTFDRYLKHAKDGQVVRRAEPRFVLRTANRYEGKK